MMPLSLLLDDKYAFRPTGSTTGAVVAVLQNITEMLEENDHVIVISMDYTKAFDSMRHEAITQPLSRLEMPDSTYNWLVRYHEDRHVRLPSSMAAAPKWL